MDVAIRGVRIYLMKERSEASQFVKDFCALLNTQFETNIKIIRSGNGSEFTSRPMQNKEWYTKLVI